MHQRFLFALCSLSLVVLAFGCSESQPLTPTPPAPPTTSSSDGTTLKVTAPSLVSPLNDVRLEGFTAPTLNAGDAQSTQGASVSPQYRFQLLNASGGLLQDSGARSSTSWTPTFPLAYDTKYLWQVRAELNERHRSVVVALGSFLSAKGSFFRGQEVLDLLTTGQTVGTRIGGQFVAGGWQATSNQDGIDYDIPTCSACTVEWDVTAFGRGEGRQVRRISSGWPWATARRGATSALFRNHPWKMHLEQRGDGNGTGMKLIWRNGKAGDGEPGDHERRSIRRTWTGVRTDVFHFVVTWNSGGYRVMVGEIEPNGTVVRQ